MKIFEKMFAVLCVASLAACSGNSDDSASEIGTGYTIEVDKTEIEADGIDAATFTVRNAAGTIVSTDDNMSKIYYKNVETGDRLDRLSTSFTSMENGTFEFAATVSGEQTVNSVKITAKNRSNYETFFRRVAGFKLTGTWCPACPLMTSAVENMSEKDKSHFVEAAFHASASDSADPYAISYGQYDLGTALLMGFGGTGYPSMLYDLDVLSVEKSSSGISKLIQEQRRKYPATSGVRIESVVSGNSIQLTAMLKSSTGGEYDLGYLLLLDNEYYPSGTATNGLYNNIVVGCSGNFMAMGSDAFTVGAGEERAVEFELPLDSFSETRRANLRVAVFSLRKADGKTIIDNIAQCAAGSSTEYEYNE